MRVVAAMDKFRGTLSAPEACAAVAAGLRRAGHEAIRVPLSDGGEGFVDALGGPNRLSTVTGPQGVPVTAAWRLADGRAVIESAAASGAALLDDSLPRDAVSATSRGTGELIAAALAAGATEVWVGIGGTASSDGGQGALDALTPWLGSDRPVTLAGRLEVFVDVTTTFTDAGRVFGPQKGASPDQVDLITQRLQEQAVRYADHFGRDVTDLDGAGAGGGLAGGLAAVGGRIRAGFAAVAAATGLERLLAGADLVITGEGRFDASSRRGKVVGGVLDLAHDHQLPTIVIAGDVESDAGAADHGLLRSLTAEYGASTAQHETAWALSDLAYRLLAP